MQLRCRSCRLPFAACCAALLCAALLRFVMQIIVNTFSLGWRWQNFIWFSTVAGSGVGAVTLLLPLPYFPLSLLSFPWLSLTFHLPLIMPSFYTPVLCRAQSASSSAACLSLSVCAQHKCCQLFTHTDAHTHLAHTHRQLPWRLHNVAARTANRAISQNFAPSATATRPPSPSLSMPPAATPQTCPKRRGVYKMRTDALHAPLTVGQGVSRRGEGEKERGRGRQPALSAGLPGIFAANWL